MGCRPPIIGKGEAVMVVVMVMEMVGMVAMMMDMVGRVEGPAVWRRDPTASVITVNVNMDTYNVNQGKGKEDTVTIRGK